MHRPIACSRVTDGIQDIRAVGIVVVSFIDMRVMLCQRPVQKYVGVVRGRLSVMV